MKEVQAFLLVLALLVWLGEAFNASSDISVAELDALLAFRDGLESDDLLSSWHENSQNHSGLRSFF